MKPQTKTKIKAAWDWIEKTLTVGTVAAGVIHVVNIFSGKGVSESAPDWAKGVNHLYHGSDKDPADEIAMVVIRNKFNEIHPGELAWWDCYIERNMKRFGESRTGKLRFKRYSHQSRFYVVRMREMLEDEVSYDAVIAFLHEVVTTMQDAYNISDAPLLTEKFEAAYKQADDFLRQHDFPVPSFTDGSGFGDLTFDTASIGTAVKSGAVGVATAAKTYAKSVVDRNRNLNEAVAERKASRSWWDRFMEF